MKILYDIPEDSVLQRTGPPVDDHQSRGGAVLQRILRDQFLWQVKIIILRGVSFRNRLCHAVRRNGCGFAGDSRLIIFFYLVTDHKFLREAFLRNAR